MSSWQWERILFASRPCRIRHAHVQTRLRSQSRLQPSYLGNAQHCARRGTPDVLDALRTCEALCHGVWWTALRLLCVNCKATTFKVRLPPPGTKHKQASAPHLHMPQHRRLPKHRALRDLEQARLLVGVQHVQLTAYEDEHVPTDLTCGQVKVCRALHCL